MSFIELFLLAIGLSMDTFAVGISLGLTMPKATIRKSLIVGLYFGAFQAVMPVIGYFAAVLFSEKIIAFDHWIAFALLCFIGGKMILESFEKEKANLKETSLALKKVFRLGETPRRFALLFSLRKACASPLRGYFLNPRECNSLGFKRMLPLALATSIDALAIGVSLAFLNANIISAASIIGITTLIVSMLGVKIGSIFGEKYKSKAEFAGGAILILIGLKILLGHL